MKDRFLVWTRRGLVQGVGGPFTQLVVGSDRFSLRRIWRRKPYIVVERSQTVAVVLRKSLFGAAGFEVRLRDGNFPDRFGGMDDEIAASFADAGWRLER